MPDKLTTIMVLKVDLQCPCCYKKIKKILCKIHQIQDQVYDEKQNTVTIKVVCCSPEKIRQKICCKGGNLIKSIEIIVPKPKEQPEKKEPPAEKKEPPAEKKEPPAEKKEPPAEKKKPPAEKKEEPPPNKNPKPEPAVRVYPPIIVPIIGVCCGPYYEGYCGGPCFPGYCRPLPRPPPRAPPPAMGYPFSPFIPRDSCCEPCSQGIFGGPCYHDHHEPPHVPTPPKSPPPVVIPVPKPADPPEPCPEPPYAIPRRTCCEECSEGISGGPCFHGHGRPPPCYEGYGRPVCDSYGGGYQGCTTM